MGAAVVSFDGVRDAALAVLPDPVLVVDADSRLLWANQAAEAWSGWTLDELLGTAIAGLVHPDDAATALASLASVAQKTYGTAIEIRVKVRNGTYRHVEVRGARVPDHPGVVTLVFRDTTDRRGWDVTAGDLRLLQVILDYAPGMTMLLDTGGRLRGSSRALTNLLGWSLETTLGSHLASLAVPADSHRVADELALAAYEPGSRTFEASFLRQDGRGSLPLALTTVNLVDDEAVHGIVVTAVDITELVEARSHLEHMAHHDALTGLPNRMAMRDRLRRALAEAERTRTTVGVLFCDLDGLKAVNDRYGHRAGDDLLRETGQRLVSAVRATDTVGRISGDEFVIVVDDVGGAELERLAERARHVIDTPMVLPGGATVRTTISVGTVLADGATTVDELLDRADAAMYSEKRSRKSMG